ncbi:MAG TPA: hypothetical protein VK807_23325 [Gemmatimonadaceae bacterium]|jgi:hypothetical protein|nr:hypothetical protein [Gemmatimonadaceae bacterium]
MNDVTEAVSKLIVGGIFLAFVVVLIKGGSNTDTVISSLAKGYSTVFGTFTNANVGGGLSAPTA